MIDAVIRSHFNIQLCHNSDGISKGGFTCEALQSEKHFTAHRRLSCEGVKNLDTRAESRASF